MSRENVEIVRRVYAHRQATGDILTDFIAPEYVWDMSHFRGWPEQQTYAGIDGARRFIREWTDAFDDWAIEVIAIHDAGDDRVVGVIQQRGRSKSTGLPVDMRLGQVLRSVTASRCGWRCMTTQTTRSKPWAWRSRRCRGRTREIVRRSFEAYASGGIEATLPFYAPDFVWDP